MHIDGLASIVFILFSLTFWFLSKWSQRYLKPGLLYSPLATLQHKKSLRQLLAWLPKGLKYTALVLLLFAWTNPRYFSERPINEQPPSNPTEGIAIYLILDESGSMMESVTNSLPTGERKTASKINLLKTLTEPFILKRTNDLIGLVSFGRTAHVQVPLTLDHQDVVNKMLELKPSIDPEEGGTAIGYAIYKTANLIAATKHFAEDLIERGEPAYKIKNAVIVLVTDGVQNVNPQDINNPLRSMDIAEATAYAKDKGIKLYIINVDPSITSEQFGPQRRLMERSAVSTGGKFYVASGANTLSDVYADIDQIEKSIINMPFSKEDQPERYQTHYLYSYLIGAGLLCLLGSIILNTTLLRRTV